MQTYDWRVSWFMVVLIKFQKVQDVDDFKQNIIDNKHTQSIPNF